MAIAPVPSQSEVQAAVRSFLTGILPPGTEIIRGLDNRVPEPKASDFVILTPIRRERLATNSHIPADCAFEASVSGNQMTVTRMQLGTILLNAVVFGPGIPDGTTITSQISGPPGGTGTYQLSSASSITQSTLASGTLGYLQKTELTIQCDVHGPNSVDNVQAISTLWRDDFAYVSLRSGGFDIAPLYAESPRLIPFQNAEQAWETRWVTELCLQANMIVSPPTQYFTTISVTLQQQA